MVGWKEDAQNSTSSINEDVKEACNIWELKLLPRTFAPETSHSSSTLMKSFNQDFNLASLAFAISYEEVPDFSSLVNLSK